MGALRSLKHALLKRLEDFPRLTNKEPRQLRELGDLLLELESAMWSVLRLGLHILTQHVVLTL